MYGWKGAKAAPAKGGAKGGEVNTDKLEQKFSDEAEQFVQALTNCDVTSAIVRAKFEKVITTRDNVLRARGQDVPPPTKPATSQAGAGKGGGAGWDQGWEAAWNDLAWMMPQMGGAPAAGQQQGSSKKGVGGIPRTITDCENIIWKQLLMMELNKERKTLPEKGEISCEVEGEVNNFTATLTIPGGTYVSAVPARNKKLAEHEAAKAAVMERFPEAFEACEAQHAAWLSGGGEDYGAVAGMWGPPAKKQKVQHETANPNIKGDLNQLVCRILGRGMTKDELSFEVTQAPGGFSATVTLAENEAGIQLNCEGAVAETKKAAENAAAAVAVEFVKQSYAQQLAQWSQSKKAKNAANSAAWKERQAMK